MFSKAVDNKKSKRRLTYLLSETNIVMTTEENVSKKKDNPTRLVAMYMAYNYLYVDLTRCIAL